MSEAYKALYRKYRPLTFDDVCGQQHVVPILKNQVQTGKTAHAYLFCGTRGTGKTTCAKILARAVNCESPVDGSPCGKCPSCLACQSGLNTDIVEMDAASNNGVNDVRELIDEISYTPTELKYRVYIIDEVHMMSTQAFNALLKTLEEPPAHVIFILATTEIHKLPATIVSRCQRFDFGRIDTSIICDRLAEVAEKEKIDVDEDALFIMAKLSLGGMRDALGYLELCAGQNGRIDGHTASVLLGVSPYDSLLSVAEAVSSKDIGAVFSHVASVCAKTNDISVFVEDLTGVYRDMLVVRSVPDYKKFIDVSPNQASMLEKAATRLSKEKLLYHIRTLNDALYLMQRNPSVKRLAAELALVKMCDEKLDTSADAVLARLSALEDKAAIGAFAQGSTPAYTQSSTDGEMKMQDISSSHSDEVSENVQSENEKNGDTQQVSKKTDKDSASTEFSGKKTPRIYRKWGEVVSKLSSNETSAVMYLNGSEAYEDETALVIVFDSEFSKTIAMTKKDKVIEAVSIVSGRKYTEKNITFSHKANASNEYTLLDEFIKENQEEN